MDWQRASVVANIGAFVVAAIWGAVQFYIWFKHGDIGVSSIVAFGLVVALLFVSALIQLKAVKATKGPVDQGLSAAAGGPAHSAGSNERIMIPLSPKQLMQMAGSGTSAHASRVLAPYVTKWITVSFAVRDVNHYRRETKIFGTDNDEATIVLNFGKEWHDRLTILNVGDKISATGQVKYVFDTSVQLENCELVENPMPLPNLPKVI